MLRPEEPEIAHEPSQHCKRNITVRGLEIYHTVREISRYLEILTLWMKPEGLIVRTQDHEKGEKNYNPSTAG